MKLYGCGGYADPCECRLAFDDDMNDLFCPPCAGAFREYLGEEFMFIRPEKLGDKILVMTARKILVNPQIFARQADNNGVVREYADLVIDLVAYRQAYRDVRMFDKADDVRQHLEKIGVGCRDTTKGQVLTCLLPELLRGEYTPRTWRYKLALIWKIIRN